MAFQQSTFNPNQQANNNQAPAEKTNFPVGRVYGSDGLINFSLWKSKNNALYTSIQLKQQIGKDPNGRVTYESGMSKDIPSILLRVDQARCLYELFNNTPPEQINYTYKQEDYGTEMTVTGSTSGVVVSVTNKVGTRKVTIPSIAMGNVNVHGDWKNFITFMWKCIDKCLMNRASEEILDKGSDDSTPF